MTATSHALAWALNQAREQSLLLVADIPPDAMHLQATPGERHPAWLLGHLLLADTYLIYLLGSQPLPEDFGALLERYGPATTPDTSSTYDSKELLIARLRETNTIRRSRVSSMSTDDLAAPLSDELLARAQPTIGHHVQSLIFHEGYHAGQLSSWRRAHRFPAVAWTMGPS